MMTRKYFLAACALVGAMGIQPMSGALAKEPQTSMEIQIADLQRAVRGQRVGLVTNPTGVDAEFRMIADRLAEDGQSTVVAFFSPEHGLRGDHQAGSKVTDYVDESTSIPVYTLYGARRAPTPEQLAELDVLVFDIQDVGARFYTYVWTMTHAMEAAAAAGKKFVVFDRPNPVGAHRVEGPPNRNDCGLVGRLWPGQPFGVATRHGMTAGELATLVNAEWMEPKVDLAVIKMPGYTRSMPFRETGRPWVVPSPNMPTLDTAVVYPGLCIFEGTNMSEGRGSTKPFEFVGAPYIDGLKLADRLNGAGLPGCRFRPVWFTPTFSKHEGKSCGGVQVHVTHEDSFDPIRTGLAVLKAVADLYPEELEIRPGIARLVGVANIQERIRNESVEEIVASWQADLEAFKALRAKHLLYPDGE